LGASIYTLLVAVTAAVGFTTQSASTILIAAGLALPASTLAVPGYYIMFGLLALVPGANPSNSSGSASCTNGGECHESVTLGNRRHGSRPRRMPSASSR
jgi:hypothetical protein